MRGGSWNNNAQNCRSANRNNNTPDNRNNNIGFRLVSPELKRMDGFPLLNRLLSRPCKRQIHQMQGSLSSFKRNTSPAYLEVYFMVQIHLRA
jgi:hypothetical protein